DWSINIRRFLRRLAPAALYVVETEIWPNLFAECHRENIPIHIINARLSGKTTAAKPWIRKLLRTSLSYVTSISTRSEDDTLRYISLGADKKIISTIGNLKFTTALGTDHSTENRPFQLDREYVLLASTHEDEESQIYKLWKQLARSELLIIAPRHPERGSYICKKLNCKNIAIRSEGQPIKDQTEVFLLDTVGELKNYFANAKLVIMGGSFVPVGGHNIFEPASANRAIITGPYMDNFKQELELMLANEAIVQVDSLEGLRIKLIAILDDTAQRQRLEKNTALLSHDAEQILRDYSDLILPL
ncbi:MAG: glycosyltransferase N-terminal domain-containing protein, partial [Gammaproteobacteria bacterium]|nr:glycosyltransferase N-terminal domain-containing protein [Gammaproteobacteria bacterium]